MATLKEGNPAYLAEWHPVLNEGLSPAQVSLHSNKKVWWHCPEGHDYQTSPDKRFRGQSCPICGRVRRVISARKNIVESRGSLAARFPEVAKEWDIAKNDDLTPDEITASSAKKYWWLCPAGHSYAASAANRTRGRGCSFCRTGKAMATFFRTVVAKRGSLASRYPVLLSSWDAEKNAGLDPALIPAHGDTVVWWKCERGHSWPTQVKQRTKMGTGCPECRPNSSKLEIRIYAEMHALWPDTAWRSKFSGMEADIASAAAGLAVEVDGFPWHLDKGHIENQKRQELLAHGLNLVQVRDYRLEPVDAHSITYRQDEDHWNVMTRLMTYVLKEGLSLEREMVQAWLGRGQFQGDKTFNYILSYLPGPAPEDSFAAMYPEAGEEWDEARNAPLLPGMFHPKSNQKFWWLCPQGHSYRMGINKRALGQGCPYCAGRRTDNTNSLARLRPEVAKYWDYERNAPLTPDDVTISSNRKVWWCCEQGHSWLGIISKRKDATLAGFCPYCNGLAAKHPEIAAEFLTEKNPGLDVRTLLPGSNKKAWWRCASGHEWQAVVGSRALRGNGCPYCSGLYRTEANSLAELYPELMHEWDTEKNAGLNPEKLGPASQIKVWWRCANGHEWQAAVHSRSRQGTGCPACYRKKIKKSG
jgi:hypothetical protein